MTKTALSFSAIEASLSLGSAYRLLYLFANYDRLREVFNAFKEHFGDRARYSEARYVAVFSNGATIVFAVCKANDVDKFSGMSVSTVAIDEGDEPEAADDFDWKFESSR